MGFNVADWTGSWFLGVAGGFLGMAVVGAILQVVIFPAHAGSDLRQTLVTIGLSIVLADLMLAVWGGNTYQFDPPSWLSGPVTLMAHPVVKYPLYRLVLLGSAIVIGVGLWLLLNKTRIGMMIRAGVDDRGMLSASGVNVQRVFAIVFALGAGLAGFAGVVGGHRPLDRAGRGYALSAGVTGGRHRRRHGQRHRCRDRRDADRLGRAIGARLPRRPTAWSTPS